MSEGDRTDRLTDREMEDMLREVGAGTGFPPEPDVSAAVRSRLESEVRPAVGRGWTASPALRIAATLVVILILALPVVNLIRGGGMSTSGEGAGGGQAAAPESGLERRVESPEPPASSSNAGDVAQSDAASASDAVPSRLGQEISLTMASEVFGGPLPLPEENGVPLSPDGVYRSGDIVVLVYGAREGLPGIGSTGIGAVLSYTRNPPSDYVGDVPEAREVGDVYFVADGGRLQPQAGDIERLPGNAVVRKVGGGSVVLRTVAPEAEAVAFAESIR